MDAEKALNAFICLVFAQVQQARKHPGLLSPKAMHGLAALMRQGIEALRYREELERAGRAVGQEEVRAVG